MKFTQTNVMTVVRRLLKAFQVKLQLRVVPPSLRSLLRPRTFKGRSTQSRNADQHGTFTIIYRHVLLFLNKARNFHDYLLNRDREVPVA